MDKQQMIRNLKTRISYNEDQREYYEGLHAEEVSKGDTITIWSEMLGYHKGKISAYETMLETIEDSQ